VDLSETRQGEILHVVISPEFCSAAPYCWLAAVAKDFKVFYKRVDGKTPGKLPIRTTPLEAALFDGNGKIRLFTVMAAVLGCWPLTSSSDQNATAVLALKKKPRVALGAFFD
jgi:hypothetical protein